MRDYSGTISIDITDFWTWIFSTFEEISDAHYIVDWTFWKEGYFTIKDSEKSFDIELPEFIIWVAKEYMAITSDEFVFEQPIEHGGYIEIKFKASNHCDPRTWNNECIITGNHICPHKEISGKLCFSCKLCSLPQRQDSLTDQLRDTISLAIKAGLYDAADIINDILKKRSEGEVSESVQDWIDFTNG